MEITARKYIIIPIVTYLMVFSLVLRGFADYPDKTFQLVPLLAVYILLMIAEPFLTRKSRVLFHIYPALHVILVIVLYIIELDGDYWAILFIPSTIYVMRNFRQAIGFLWVGIFTVTITVMLIIGYKELAPQFIIVYFAAFMFFASYALMLRQNEAAQKETQRLLSEFQKANEQLRAYASQAEDLATIKERNRLARELHDSVTQSIFTMTLLTRSARILQERDPSQVTEKLDQLQDLAQNALGEMRNLIYHLRPMSIAEQGLIPVLQEHIDTIKNREQITIDLILDEKELPLSHEQQQELFRIIQEALNNITKHAQVDHASVQFSVSEGYVHVAIQDNGTGFDPASQTHSRQHIGLSSMRERAEEMGGEINFVSEPGKGTKIDINIPGKKG